MNQRQYKIYGKATWYIKDELASLGCYWNPHETCWDTNPMTNIEVAMLDKLLENRDIELIKVDDIAGDVTIENFFKELNKDFTVD